MIRIQVLAAVGLALGTTAASSAQRVARHDAVLPRAEVAIDYSYMRANATPGVCGCFNMNGGSTEVAVRAYRNFSGVFDLTGTHAGTTSVVNQSLSLVSFTGGPRFSYPVQSGGRTRVIPFVQGLVGAVHGFDAPFPTGSGLTSRSATNLAVFVGGGLDVPVRHVFAIRAVQVDYGLNHLPNNANNSENLLRVSAGVVFHIR